MSGVDFFTISKWSGHASLKMIETVYGHLTPGFRAEQMARINFDSFSNGLPKPDVQPVVEAVKTPAPQPT
jgi:hypothetical protein